MNPSDAWQAALGELQLQMTRATFDTWVKQSSVVGYEDGVFVIAVRSSFAKEWLENRLMGLIKRTLSHIMGRSVELRFSVQPVEHQLSTATAGPLLNLPKDEPVKHRAFSGIDAGLHLNNKYRFDTFIVGSHNRLAHAAARAVAENPASSFNPLFLYGGVGLGKTHLLQAIGHYSQENNCVVRYISSEQFTNELILAIRSQSTASFREKYRSIDVLLIDDIQFIAGKESTQEEFFHTFNTLHAADKQIVICSDRAPKFIAPLEERLRSRFEGGLTADISPPDLETRIAILHAKAEAHNAVVPPEVVEFIARKVQSNIRELEGSLNRVLLYGSMLGASLTVEVSAEALRDFIDRTKSLEPEQILAVVSQHYHLSLEEILGSRRNRDISTARQMAMYLLRSELQLSLPQIGSLLGGRDHTTVLHGCEKIRSAIEEDISMRRDYLAVREMLVLSHHPLSR